MTGAQPTPISSADRRELFILGILSTILLAGMTPILGVWEPWESDVAQALDLMRGDGSWWSIVVPGAKDALRTVPELPYGLWPSAGLSAVLGVNEWSLRLPGIVLGLGVVMTAFHVVYRVFGRSAAWFSALGLLCMPMFVFHTRLAFGTAVGLQSSALAALAFLHLLTSTPDALGRRAWAWRALAWLSFAWAGLAAGVVGLAGPIGVLIVGLAARAHLSPDRIEAPGIRGLLQNGLLFLVIASVGLFGFGLTRVGAIVTGAGLLVLAIALGLSGSARTLRRDGVFKHLAPLPLVLGALALLGAGFYMAARVLPEDQSLRALLLWINDFDGPGTVAKRPAFDAFIHQIGFGLFPLSAFVPLAFADLIYDDATTTAQRTAVLATTTWFAFGFLAPALGMPFSHVGFFFAAPAVAIAVGVYFKRALTSPPQPVLTLVAVLLLALLDSNLKHQTQSLADTLVGSPVDAFPPELAGWGFARLLSLALLGALILYQGGAMRLVRGTVARVFYPTRKPRLFEGWLLLWALALGVILVQVAVVVLKALGQPMALVEFTDWVRTSRSWGRVAVAGRFAILGGAAIVVMYVVAYGVWLIRAIRLDGSREGLLMRATDTLLDLLAPTRSALIVMAGILVCWAAFMNVSVTRAMTTNFSQKEMINRYTDLKTGDQPLLTYQLDTRTSSFYARSLDVMDRQAFRARMPGEDRVFAIVPRKNLASINKDFRALTGRTLPVLDDRSYRVLLVSNQIQDGEEDFNPITRALISELPKGATKTNHVFDDRIELAGWKLTPDEPQPGSELTISLFWRVKKRVAGRWKVFVHIDAPGQRIHADHDPVEGMFPTDNWKPGDLIRDDHRVVVKRTQGRGRHTFYVGLFRGSKRMPITQGDKDRENRARIGKVRVR